MAEIIAFPLPLGPNYTIPDPGDVNWGQAVTDFLTAIPVGVVPTQGTFSLTGDLNFGTSFGIVAEYFKSPSPNTAHTGLFRMAHGDSISWRNFANSADNALTTNNSDQLLFNGVVIGSATSVLSITGTANQIIASSVGAVTLSTPQDIATTSDVTFGSLIASNLSASELIVTDGSKKLVSQASPTLTELGYVGGVSSAIQTQLNSKAPTASPTFTGTVTVPNGVNPTDAAAYGQVTALASFSSGDIKMSGSSSPQSGWLLCDGTSYLRATYPTLFAVIGTTFGSADGTHFNVPSTANNVPIGAGSIAALGVTAGSQTHVISGGELPTHNHGVTDPGHAHVEQVYENLAGGPNFLPQGGFGGSPVLHHVGTTDSNTTGISIQNAGASSAMSLVQPSLGFIFFIKI